MSDPTGHQGPFVDPPRGGRLLRRLFGSGGGEQPLATPPQSTTTHSTPATHAEPGTARSMPRTDHNVPTTPSRPGRRSIGLTILGWLWARLKWRLILTSLVLVGVLIAMKVDPDVSGTTSGPISRLKIPRTNTYQPTPGDAAPDSTVKAGTELVTVDRIRGTRVTTTDILSRTYTWFAIDPAIRRQLAAGGDKRMIVHWERNGAGNVVITRVLVTDTVAPKS